MEFDATLFELVESILPRSVAVMNGFGTVGKLLRIVQKQFGGEHGFTASRGTGHHQTGRRMKSKRWTTFYGSIIAGIVKSIMRRFVVLRVICVQSGLRSQCIDGLSRDPIVTS